jgi:hypothetical protein
MRPDLAFLCSPPRCSVTAGAVNCSVAEAVGRSARLGYLEITRRTGDGCRRIYLEKMLGPDRPGRAVCSGPRC